MKEKPFKRQEELPEAALDEFSAKTYDEASLNRIIRKAGISKGTFYYHFADKQALYLDVLEHGVQAKWKFIHEASQNGAETQGSKDIFELFKLRPDWLIAHLFASFHDIFAEDEDLEVERMLQNLDAYVDFMRHGLERRVDHENERTKTL